eukprot:CAMPEP_0181093202 /NCGR_PEP_ID=MMETSP1071-20121207/9321_1 /TAXON_ID=35127 /ORGANISM="Thalassiosira sp., Strain NH16" /LENGTH=846 /DNA_ID=CAMNT_0023175423 /DNA_START=77 /DNA_END=2616 /DNA_ORIENTATION=+
MGRAEKSPSWGSKIQLRPRRRFLILIRASREGTARLAVSLAFSKKKGPPLSSEYRPWSKHSVGSSRHAKLQQNHEEKEQQASLDKKEQPNENGETKELSTKDVESDETNRKREEFLSALGISSSSSKQGKDGGKVSKSQFWANDDAIVEPGDGTDSDSSSSGSDSDSEDDVTNNNFETKKGGKDKTSSDFDFLRSKQVKADVLTDESDNEGKDDVEIAASSSSDSDDSSSGSDSSSEGEDEGGADKSSGEKINNKSSQGSVVPESSADLEISNVTSNAEPSSAQLLDRLFVRNLPFTTTEEDLFETFSQFGHVTSVHIPIDDTKRNKGYAFITFEIKKDAKLAIDSMDGEDFQGRLIHILPARPSADQTNDMDPNLTYKERQALARQKEAENSSNSWSASFLRGDAVLDNLSDRLGVSKGDVLNVKDGISSGNAAVRLALGETHIISENIAFFEEHGVDVTALEAKSKKKGGGSGGAPKRSKTMILVKNLPGDTSLEDLTKVFHAIGGDAPQRILLPPSKTAALVEYDHATDARRAFRRLAYKKFKHVPLYLEWAPMMPDGERNKSPTVDHTKKDVPTKESSGIVVKRGIVEEDPSVETAGTGISLTVYVKNLNFSTNEDQLEKVFTKSGFSPRAVKIPTKAAPLKKQHKPSTTPATDSSNKKETRQVSMGFGFVEFPSEEEALKAMKELQGKVVDGHALEIKLSTKSLSSAKLPSSAAAAEKSAKNTKIMVRNVPFEATRTELLQLFGSFGQLKKVRLPKKFDGTHRGFAFCEFVTSKEAQNAMETLSRTHLYGRHLVLEWASAAEDDGNGKVDLDVIREKAKRDAMQAGLDGGGSRKKGKHLIF